MKDEILTLLSDDDYMDRSIDLLAKRLDCFSSENFVKLVKIMNELEEAGKVIRNKYNHYYCNNIYFSDVYLWRKRLEQMYFCSGV